MKAISRANTVTVHINEFMTPHSVDLSSLKNHLMNIGFFINEIDARCAMTLMVPSVALLGQLTKQYDVQVTIWLKKEADHPGWEFTCADRATINMGFSGHAAGVTDSAFAGAHPNSGTGY